MKINLNEVLYAFSLGLDAAEYEFLNVKPGHSKRIAALSIITGKAIGSAYTIMNSKALGADMVFALDTAKIGPMEAELEAQITGTDAKAVADSQDATMAAKRGYVDSIIDAASARKNLVYAFEMLY